MIIEEEATKEDRTMVEEEMMVVIEVEGTPGVEEEEEEDFAGTDLVIWDSTEIVHPKEMAIKVKETTSILTTINSNQRFKWTHLKRSRKISTS
tara:strand:- start:753 stop:1031 length:279 start_codon:yes stop_codon:yes gene_type:complete